MGCRSCSPPLTPSPPPTASGSGRVRAARLACSRRKRSWATSWVTPLSSTALALEREQGTRDARAKDRLLPPLPASRCLAQAGREGEEGFLRGRGLLGT